MKELRQRYRQEQRSISPLQINRILKLEENKQNIEIPQGGV